VPAKTITAVIFTLSNDTHHLSAWYSGNDMLIYRLLQGCYSAFTYKGVIVRALDSLSTSYG